MRLAKALLRHGGPTATIRKSGEVQQDPQMDRTNTRIPQKVCRKLSPLRRRHHSPPLLRAAFAKASASLRLRSAISLFLDQRESMPNFMGGSCSPRLIAL